MSDGTSPRAERVMALVRWALLVAVTFAFGGFLLQRGKVRTNVSLTVLVEQARKDLEIEVAKDLFSTDADTGRSR